MGNGWVQKQLRLTLLSAPVSGIMFKFANSNKIIRVLPFHRLTRGTAPRHTNTPGASCVGRGAWGLGPGAWGLGRRAWALNKGGCFQRFAMFGKCH